MKLIQARVRGFRRLEDVLIDFEGSETVFVGPNNSGKTSATDIFRLFLKSGEFSIHDFSVSQVSMLDSFVKTPSVLDAWPGICYVRIGVTL